MPAGVVAKISLRDERRRAVGIAHRQRKICDAAAVGHEIGRRGLRVSRSAAVLKLVLLWVFGIVAPIVADPEFRIGGWEDERSRLVQNGYFAVHVSREPVGDAVVARAKFHFRLAAIQSKRGFLRPEERPPVSKHRNHSAAVRYAVSAVWRNGGLRSRRGGAQG